MMWLQNVYKTKNVIFMQNTLGRTTIIHMFREATYIKMFSCVFFLVFFTPINVDRKKIPFINVQEMEMQNNIDF